MLGKKLLWAALPLAIGSVCAGSVYMGWTNFWGPLFALSVALAAYKAGLRWGLFAAVQAFLIYDYVVIDPPWEFTFYKNVPLPPVIAFFGAAIIFGRIRAEEAQRILRSPEDIVSFLGGPDKAAEWAGVDKAYIEDWIILHHVQPGWHYRLMAEAKKHGYDVTLEAFGLLPSSLPVGIQSRLNSLSQIVAKTARVSPKDPIQR